MRRVDEDTSFSIDRPIRLVLREAASKVSLVEEALRLYAGRQQSDEVVLQKAVVELSEIRTLRQELINAGFSGALVKRIITAFFALSLDTWRKDKPGGVLFHGPPGTGKSFLCTTIMKLLGKKERGCVLFSGVSSHLNEKYVGEAEKRLRGMMELANKKPNRLFFIFIDEVHGLAKRQMGGKESDHKLDTLLSLLELMASLPHNNIVFLFATNFKEALDPAFLRSKRVDAEILVPAHSWKQREEKISSMIEEWEAKCRAKQQDVVQKLCGQSKTLPNMTAVAVRDENVPCASPMNVSDRQRLCKWFCLVTANFVTSQFLSLEGKMRVAEAMQTLEDEDGAVSNSSAPSLWTHILDLFQRSEFTKSLAPLYGPVVERTEPRPISVGLRHWLIKQSKANMSGKVLVMGPSSSVAVELQRDRQDSYMNFFAVPGNGRCCDVNLCIRTILANFEPDNVIVVDGRFRRNRDGTIEEGLEEALSYCRDVGADATITHGNILAHRSAILVEFDEFVGMEATSVAVQKGRSLGKQSSVGHTDGSSRSLALGMSLSNSAQNGVSFSVGRGTQTQQQSSHTQGTSTSHSTGTSTSSGSSQSYGQYGGYSQSSSSGTSTTDGTGTNESTTTGTSTGTSRQTQKTTSNSTGTQDGKTKQVTDVRNVSVNVGSSTSDTETNSKTVTWQVLFPQALHALNNTLAKIDRTKHPNDPFVVVVYRIFEPSMIEGYEFSARPEVVILDSSTGKELICETYTDDVANLSPQELLERKGLSTVKQIQCGGRVFERGALKDMEANLLNADFVMYV